MQPLKFDDPIKHQFLPGQTIRMVIRHHNNNTQFDDIQWDYLMTEFNRLNGLTNPRPGDFFLIPHITD